MSGFVGEGTPLTAQGSVDGTDQATYELPLLGRFVVESVVASIDASGGGDTTPTLTVLDKSGAVIARKAQTQKIPAGDTGDATWALRLSDDAAASPSGAGWMFDTDPQAGSWGVLSVNGVDPTPYAFAPRPGSYPFRISVDLDTATAAGILFAANGTVVNPDHWSYLNLGAGRATMEAQAIVEIQTFSKNALNIGSVIIELPNIPTNNVGLVAGEVYRAGAGPDSVLMVK